MASAGRIPSRVLITGGCGFVGSNLVRLIGSVSPATHIVVLDRLTYAGQSINIEAVDPQPQLVIGDVCDRALVDKLVQSVDVVIHCAAESHNDASELDPTPFVATNVEGTFTVLEACRKHGVRYHHVSTDEVFGDLALNDPRTFSEASPYRPSSPYSATKASSDLLVQAWIRTYGLQATITNCTNNYGPYQHVEKFIPRQITNILTGRRPHLYGDGLHIRDWVHVEDHARAIWAVVTRGAIGESYVVGSGHGTSNRDILAQILKAMDQPSDAFVCVADRPGHDRRYAVDPSKIMNECDWQPCYTNMAQGIAQTVAWYRNNRAWWESQKEKTEAFYTRLGR